MRIVDAQLHEIGPRLDWGGIDTPRRWALLTELTLAWMDSVGVQGTLIHAVDDAWGRSACAANPDRFALVLTMREPEAPDIEERVKELRATRGVVATRIFFGMLPSDPTGEAGAAKFRAGAFARLFAACERSNLPLFCGAFGLTPLVGEIAEAHPKLKLCVDHMGIAQPPLSPLPSPPWGAVPDLLALARFPNVYVKLCGAPVLSNQGYPFDDVWPHVRAILDAFGSERVMWASDIGRFEGRIGWQNLYPAARGAYQGKHTYAESLFFITSTDKLSRAEKEQLLSGAVKRLTGWPGQ